MADDIPDLPGYISTKEAVKLLGVSERRVPLYIEMQRLPAVRAADILLIPLEQVKTFKRQIVGRPRKNTPAWRISSNENTQFLTFIAVQIQAGYEERLTQRLDEMKRHGQHLFPGTVARYVVKSETVPGQVEIVLVWRTSVMPNDLERVRALEAFRQMLSDVLDWNTATYSHGQILMHT